MSNKPNPRRDDKGVPWCGGIKESCWRGCQWVNFKICLPQVQLDEAELARLQGIVDGEKLRITQAIASFSASTQEGFMTKPFDKPVSLPDCLLRGREAMAIVDKLPPIVKAVMERREYHECWEGDYDSADGPGDCGNWPTCPEECPLKQLLLIAGFEPREDGSTREAAESAKPPAKQPSAHPRTRP